MPRRAFYPAFRGSAFGSIADGFGPSAGSGTDSVSNGYAAPPIGRRLYRFTLKTEN